MSKLWWLRSASLLQELSPQETTYLFHLMSPSSYEANNVIFSSDLPGDVLYFIQQGEVRIIQKTRAGTKKTLTVLSGGYIFGLLSLIDIGWKQAFVITQSHSHMMVLRKQAFEKLIKYCPDMGARMVGFLKDNIGEQKKQKMKEEMVNGYRRISRLLYDYLENPHFEIQEKRCDFRYSPQEIAQLSQTSLEVVENSIQLLQQRRIIEIHHQNLKLCDRMRLREQF